MFMLVSEKVPGVCGGGIFDKVLVYIAQAPRLYPHLKELACMSMLYLVLVLSCERGAILFDDV